MTADDKKALMKIMLAMRAAEGDPLPERLEKHREKLANMAMIVPKEKSVTVEATGEKENANELG